MTFNSLAFVLFFLTVTPVYWMLRGQGRIYWLALASAYFYMYWNPYLILVIIFSTSVDYFAGLAMARSERKRPWLVLSLSANLGILSLFKYYDFLAASANSLGAQIPLLGLILPIGISFHTFQAMSYILDLYAGRIQAERSYPRYLVYVLFYPQLVSGPIERAHQFLHQLAADRVFVSERVISGLRMMLWGFFKKTVIADRLALYVNPVYASPEQFVGPPLAVATVFFAFQIYCDFSGYTDIARGAARVMGYELMVNFRRPYFSVSVADFWRRWHISLSTWFRDYVYLPLGGNRVSTARWAFNVMVVFLLSGIWHGANWTFAVWGALHGVYLLVERLLSRLSWKIPRFVLILSTFVLVCISWVLFRAQSLEDAVYVLGHMFASDPQLIHSWNGVGAVSLTACWGLIALLMIVQGAQERHWLHMEEMVACWRRPTRWAWYLAMLLGILFGGVDKTSEFIYFQF
ncbi:MBOAT family protein [bacterium CPR1]|nr:MBOAT family protein [bacterium CPR1]